MEKIEENSIYKMPFCAMPSVYFPEFHLNKPAFHLIGSTWFAHTNSLATWMHHRSERYVASSRFDSILMQQIAPDLEDISSMLCTIAHLDHPIMKSYNVNKYSLGLRLFQFTILFTLDKWLVSGVSHSQYASHRCVLHAQTPYDLSIEFLTYEVDVIE